MTEKEAFEAWWKTINQTIGYVAATAAWQAACAWQRERDAEICDRFGDRQMHPHECRDAIRNQGDE